MSKRLGESYANPIDQPHDMLRFYLQAASGHELRFEVERDYKSNLQDAQHIVHGTINDAV